MSRRNVPEALTIDAALVERFRADLALLCDPARDRILVAVSGGPDSMALLLLTHAAIGTRCLAATVDHRLRARSADEAAFVAGFCADRGIAHRVLADTLPDRAGRTANLSARARLMRYALLDHHMKAVDARYVATGHHADDQAETFVMRLNRGAGVSGLAAVRASGASRIRPLLGWRKRELAAIVESCGVDAIADPSNGDDRYDRARLRKAMASADWLEVEQIGRSAKALADADAALRWFITRLPSDICELGEGKASLRAHGLPFEVRRRLVAQCIQHVRPGAEPRGPALERTILTLEGGKCCTLGGVLCAPDVASLKGASWTFRPVPPRRARP